MKQIYLNRFFLSSDSRSAWGFLLKIAISIFCAETLIMLVFLSLPKLPDLVEILVDSTLLSVLIAPALYFFVYRPLVREISLRSAIELELRKSQELLEQQAQELEETLKKLQQAPQLIQVEKMSSLGRLVAGIAHEINNPINFVYGNLTHVREYVENLIELLHLYEKYYPDPKPEIQARSEEIDVEFLQKDLTKILNSMKIGCDRIRQIVLSLRNFSRMDEAEYKLVDIHEGIESSLSILQHRLKSKAQFSEIEVVKNYGKLPEVECFPGQLNQVFMNILSNAIDAIEEGIKTRNCKMVDKCPFVVPQQLLAPTIKIRTSLVDSQWVEIAIADNGSGIPEEIRQKIFEPFFTTKPVGKGTGIGLSISYPIIVEKHGGKLNYFSTMGEGTEFIIQIPLRLPAENLVQGFKKDSPKSFQKVR